MSRILVIKLGALGDVVMATALVRAIRAGHCGARVTVLTTPPFADLFRAWPGLAVRAVPRRGLGHGLRTIAWIRRQGFSRLYDLQSNDRTALWVALSGVAERVGNHPRWPYTHHPSRPWRGEEHIFDRMNAVLAAAGLAPAAARPELPLDGAGRARVARWRASQGLQAGRYVLVHAGASARRRSAKSWPHFAALAPRLVGHGLTPVWIGAGTDRPINRELAAVAGLDATDAFSIAELAELGRGARFALTNDSGPMHALAAAGIPVYGFFGPSDWRRNHALGQGERVFAHPDLAAIAPEQVLVRLARDGLLDG